MEKKIARGGKEEKEKETAFTKNETSEEKLFF